MRKIKNIRKKIAVLIVLYIFAILTLLNNDANGFEVNPEILTITGNKGDFVLQSIEIYNDNNEEITVNISITGINNYYLPKSVFKLNPYERKQITIGFFINNSQTGIITYTYNNSVFVQMVKIEINKVNPSVLIFPQKPKPGGTMVILLQSSISIDANGFLFFSDTGNTYILTITDNIGFVQLNEDEKGEGMLYLYGNQINPIFYSFNLSDNSNAPATTEELSLEVPQNVNVFETKNIRLKAGGKGVKGTINAISPSGEKITEETDSSGNAYIYFDEGGKWTIIGEYGGQTVTKTINVKRKDMDIQILTDKPTTGNKVEIRTMENSYYVISGAETINGFTYDGNIQFTPNSWGDYEIYAYNDAYEGTKSFKVYRKSAILLVDENGYTVYNAKKGELLFIKVVDAKTKEVIEDADQISITDEKGNQFYLTLNNGETMWKPESSGWYKIKFDGDEDIMEAMMSINIYGSGKSIPVWIIGIIIALIIVMAIFIKRKGGKLNLDFLKG